ncbi:MAG: sulfatase-like hydrolase/transferase [Candidatus Poribacteria bacterium]|jgi:arylsulfatase A-like enzyme|nr:sulfatase-like hydrolase/transferase [Candidatus Poribacteria bacterium]MDP6750515.1 sulfatase-like hydrolase/transferase [Candidatus Poribacteria bacterium]MDP6998332.1 sulfatase-like hydrolase/transferase [Candidatus Poribacteria bacterium]
MSQPNFIIFLTDDQGYGDLSCMGATDFRTPNLDRMAAGGVRFTNWYSNSPVCSPSRAALLTGRYPGNAGVRSILAGHRTATGLPTEVPTIANALQDLGYYTAMSGKWHLGLAEGSRPENHGFDDWFGFMAGCIDFYSHIFYWQMNRDGRAQLHDLWENGIEIYRDGEYFTELITEYTIKYVRRAIEQNKPFLLYVPYNAPHYPMHAPAKYVERFPNLSWDRQIMAAMLSAVDDSVGEILNELERQGILDNTFTYFQSDNGPSREIRNWLDGTPDPYYGGSAGKLKGHKFSLYEGGIRSPGIMSWPDKVTAGQVVDQPGAAMDVFPTFLSAAGGDPNDYQLDGKNVMPMLTEGRPSPHDAIFWEMSQQTAVRRGKWKLVLNGQLVEGAPTEDDVHLADLETDMGETDNRKDQHPELTAELTQLAQTWRQGIEDRWQNEWQPRTNGTTGKTN